MKSIIQTDFRTLVTFSALYYSSFIFITSVSTYISASVHKISGSSAWTLQLSGEVFLIEHLANIFRISTGIPKNLSNIIMLIILWATLVISIAFIEGGFYGFILNRVRHNESTFLDFAQSNWKKLLYFLICFTPFFIFAGLIGFFSEFLLLKIGLASIYSKIISFMLITAVLTPFIPARFYYLDGKSLTKSLLISLEQMRNYSLLIFPLISISGIIALVFSNHLFSTPNSVLTIISYSPLIVIIGFLSWFFYGISIIKTGERYDKINNKDLPQGGNFDKFLE